MTSSLTMAVASQAAAARRNFRLIIGGLVVTAALVLLSWQKSFEYKKDIDKYLLPGLQFAVKETGAQLFFGLYWLVTGVHAVRLSIDIVLVSRIALLGYRNKLELEENPELEVTGLYWHLVDIVWIFHFPLIYLPGRVS